MRKKFLRLKYIIIVIVICFSGKVCFSLSLDGVLKDNDYIELENKEQQIIKLNIKKDGLYAIKTSGSNGVILHLIDKKNKKIEPKFIEYDGNFFAIYSLDSKNTYYANVKMKIQDKSEKSKVASYFLDDAVLVENKSMDGTISNCGEDMFFKFIPKKTETYMIKSLGNLDLKASIYDENGNKVQESSDITGLNFKILDKFSKDKCYYIRVGSYSDKGNFEIDISEKKIRNKDVIDLEMNDNLDNVFRGCVKKGENNITFVSDVDGEYKFVLMSEMNLKIIIEDEEQNIVSKCCECNTNYSFAVLEAKKGQEYIVKIVSDSKETGAYKLRILNFKKLRENSNDIVIGKNEGNMTRDDNYLKFICPDDGIYNFENVGIHDLLLDFYDENGKLIKKTEKNLAVRNSIFGVKAKKGDTLYLKVSNNCCNVVNFDYGIEVNNFSDLIKNCKTASIGQISDCMKEEEETHFYKFIPKRNGTYFIKLKCNKSLRYGVFDSEGNLLFENLRNKDAVIAGELEQDKTYYIYVVGSDFTGDFAFEVLLINDIKKIDIKEDEEIYNEVEYLGEVKQYEFCASEDAFYVPKIESLIDVDICIRDDNGSVVRNMNLKKGEKRIIEISSASNIGEYCFKVENFTDKMNSATEIVCDTEYQGNIIIPGMKNNYSFVPKNSGYYSIYAVSDLNMKSEIYDSDGILVAKNKNKIDSNFCLIAKLEKGEKYLITISEENRKDTGIYALFIQQNKESKNKSEWIKLDRVKLDILGYDGEEKIYKIIIPESGKYFIDNYFDLDLNIEVTDKNGKVQLNQNKGNDTNHNLYELNENNLYYIKVKAKDGIQTGVYNLKIESLKKAYKNAKLINYNRFETIDETKNWKIKYYKIEFSFSGIYNILKLCDEEIYVHILDADGNIVVSDNLEKCLDIEFNRGVYYLRFISSNNNEILISSKIINRNSKA